MADGGQEVVCDLTFYTCIGGYGAYCGTMANGQVVFPGAAACGYAFMLGQRFQIVDDPTGRIYECCDRGLGPYWWIDIWFYDIAEGQAWRNQLGNPVTIRLLP